MWELGSVYTGMAKTLNDFERNNYMYDANSYEPPNLLIKNKKKQNLEKEGIFSFASIWQTFEVLSEVARPIDEGNWEEFHLPQK